MAVDPYSPCPCGSGKKLKFCCSDLAPEIDKITKLVSSDQPHAALKHVEKLLEREPDRPSLLDIRAMLELSLHELDAAESTLRHFLAVAPANPSANGQAAILAAARGEAQTAIEKLQDALDHTDNEMPQRVFEAIGAVGHALLLEGDLVAARAHLLLYAGVAPEGDNRAIELLLRLNLQGGLPLLLRDSLQLLETPAAQTNKGAFDEALRLARRGRWRRGVAEMEKLLDEANPDPAVVYDLAVLRGWTGHREQFAAGLHRYAGLAVPLDDAVEAEALAQLVDPRGEEHRLASVRVVFGLNDEDAVATALASDKRVERYELDPQSLDEDEVARPRSTHILLDRPVPQSGENLTVAEAPNVLAFLSLYGKRTDRGARLELTTDRGDRFDEVKRLTAEILGASLTAEEDTTVVAEKSASEEALSWRWRLPDDTPAPRRRQLLSERRRRAILEDWTAAPRTALNGLSPRQASEKPELRIPLLGSVLIIEQAAVDPAETALFDELRQSLGLPAAESIDPATVDWDHLPLIRLPRLQMKAAPLDRLMQLFNRAVMAGAGVATLALAEEIVSRDSQDEGIAAVYRQLIRAEPDPDRAIHWTERAKQWAQQAGQPGGEWALLELEVHIERGDVAGVQNALNEIRQKHVNEPGVADATYRLLYSAGLLTPQGAPAGAPASPLEAPAAQASRLWTPGQETAAPAGSAKPAIWTP